MGRHLALNNPKKKKNEASLTHHILLVSIMQCIKNYNSVLFAAINVNIHVEIVLNAICIVHLHLGMHLLVFIPYQLIFMQIILIFLSDGIKITRKRCR